VLPNRGHPTTGCESFAFAFVPNAIERLEGILDVIKRREAGEIVVHCHCLATANLKPCSNCGFLLCPNHLLSHEAGCTLPKDSRRPGMPYSQPKKEDAS
jgi:hypothetical protein